MNNKRFLFLIQNDNEISEAKKFIISLKKKFDFEFNAIYPKDLTKYEIFNRNVTGLNTATPTPTTIRMDDYLDIEDSRYNQLKENPDNIFDNFVSVAGDVIDVVLEEMKAYDVLVIFKNNKLSSTEMSLIKEHYKPIILLTCGKQKYDFEKIVMLNDGGYSVNKSVFAFFNIFGTFNIDVLRVNVEENNRLTEKFGDICNIIDKTGDNEFEIISQYIVDYDLAIMGNLKYSYIIERITGQTGIKILQSGKIPIFIY